MKKPERKMHLRHLLLAALTVCAQGAQAQQGSSTTRGELLYGNHCVECHTTQMHWRERRQARDWPSLLAQVQRWQATTGLQWSEADVTEVARYLDRTIYRFAPQARQESATQTARAGSGTRCTTAWQEAPAGAARR